MWDYTVLPGNQVKFIQQQYESNLSIEYELQIIKFRVKYVFGLYKYINFSF